MLSFLKALWHDKRGNVLVLTGAALPLLVGSAGLATDTIQWALWKRQLQRAADSAAIAGVRERIASKQTSGVKGVVNKDLEINQHTGIGLAGPPEVSFPTDTGDMTTQVHVRLKVRKPLTFSSMFMSAAPLIQAEATAASVPGTDTYCVVSLEKTTAMGIQGSGDGEIRTDCAWITNSVGSVAAMAKGSSNIYATVIAAAGAIQESANFHIDRYEPYIPQIDDPFAGDEYKPNAADMRCATTALTDSTSQSSYYNAATQQLTSNCFPSLSVGSNRSLTLPANQTYYINGGSVNIQGNLYCTGCTIVLTNASASPTATIGTFNMNSKGNVQLSAPNVGKYAGIAIYQDSRAVDSGTGSANNMPANAPNKINGNSVSFIEGVLYFPKQQLTYNGNGNGDWRCTQFVARRVQFGGNNISKFTDSGPACSGRTVPDIQGGRRVRLVA